MLKRKKKEDNCMLNRVESCIVLANDNESIVLEHGVSLHTFCLLADALEPRHAKITEEKDDDWHEAEIPEYSVLRLSAEQTQFFSVSSSGKWYPQTSICSCRFFFFSCRELTLNYFL